MADEGAIQETAGVFMITQMMADGKKTFGEANPAAPAGRRTTAAAGD